MIKKAVGIYVSKNMLQFTMLSKNFNRVRLLGAESIKIDHDISIVSPSSPGNEKISSFTASVKNFLKQHGIKEGQVIAVALAPESVVIRYFQMPRLAVQEHKTAVVFEARKYLPYKIDEVVHAYAISYDKVASNKMAVTFVAAEKNSVSGYIRFFEKLGLRVGYMEAIPYSLMRLLYYIKDTELNQTVALVHIGQESAQINLIRNKILYLTRNVNFSGKLNRPASLQAEENISDSKFDSLFSEVRLSFDYFHRQFPEEKIEKMITWTDDKAIQDKIQAASKDLNVYTKSSNPFNAIEKAGGYSLDYAISAGLALRILHNPNRDINLSPGFKKMEIEGLAKTAVIEVCIAAVFLFVFYIIDGNKIMALQLELARILGERSAIEMRAGNIAISNIENSKAKLQEKYNYLSKLKENKFSVALKLNKIGYLMPEGLWLVGVDCGKPRGKSSVKKSFMIKGYAWRQKGDDQIKTVNQFLENLKKDTYFNKGFIDIKLDSILNEKYAGVPVTSFQISCVME